MACKGTGDDRTLNEIINLSKVPKTEFKGCASVHLKDKSIRELFKGCGISNAPMDPMKLIGRLSGYLGIKMIGVVHFTELLVQSVREDGALEGRLPDTIAGAVLLMAGILWDGEAKKSAKEISSVTGSGLKTIREAF